MKAGPYIQSAYNREMYAAKACESEIAILRRKIEACEKQRDEHLAAAARWSSNTDLAATNGERQ
jgi:hypothetical protein